MAYVVAEPCIGVKDKACVEVCPVDCIHGDDDSAQMFINPNECITCGGCVAECPVGAIFDEDDLPPKWRTPSNSTRRTSIEFAYGPNP